MFLLPETDYRETDPHPGFKKLNSPNSFCWSQNDGSKPWQTRLSLICPPSLSRYRKDFGGRCRGGAEGRRLLLRPRCDWQRCARAHDVGGRFHHSLTVKTVDQIHFYNLIIKADSLCSRLAVLILSVPQGSLLGPLLYGLFSVIL